MNKSLEWLNYYKKKLQESNITFRPSGFEIIEKDLKAFEIIKKRECIFRGLQDTTQEEYDLLREVLK